MNKDKLSDRDIILRFMASMSLADHIGDIAEDAFEVFKLLGIKLPDTVDHIDKFGAFLHREGLCSKTIVGSDIDDDGFDKDYEWEGY